MKTKRIGCFTGSGLIAGLLTLLFISGVALARGGMLLIRVRSTLRQAHSQWEALPRMRKQGEAVLPVTQPSGRAK
jgi:hypothetical protein